MLKLIKKFFLGKEEDKKPRQKCNNPCDWASLVRKFAIKGVRGVSGGNKQVANIPQKLSAKQVKQLIKFLKMELVDLKKSKTLTTQVDAMVGTMYYILSIAGECGINLDPIFRVVHQKNMKKVDVNVSVCENTGKYLPPYGVKSPHDDIERELTNQEVLGSFPAENK